MAFNLTKTPIDYIQYKEPANSTTLNRPIEDVESSIDTLISTFNSMPSGFSDLNESEVSSLQNIDNATISVVQWGYLGDLDQSLTIGSSVEFASINQGNNLVLDVSDLQSNGGNLPETDRTNIWSSNQTFNAGIRIQNATDFTYENSSGNDVRVLHLSGSNELLFAESGSGIKFTNQANDTLGKMHSDGGLVWGLSTNGSQGSGTVNAEGLYQDGDQVLDVTDLQANGGSLPETDRQNTWTGGRQQFTGGGAAFIGGVSENHILHQVDDDSTTRIIELQDSNGNTVAHMLSYNLDGSGNGGFRLEGNWIFGVPSGEFQGSGTLNAEGLYQDGDSVLDASDLQANGGNIPQTDRDNIFTVGQTVSESGRVHIHLERIGSNAGDWTLGFWGTGFALAKGTDPGSTNRFLQLDYSSDDDLVGFYDGNSGTRLGRFSFDYGFVVGTPSGDSQGTGTINSVSLFQDGEQVIDNSNVGTSLSQIATNQQLANGIARSIGNQYIGKVFDNVDDMSNNENDFCLIVLERFFETDGSGQDDDFSFLTIYGSRIPGSSTSTFTFNLASRPHTAGGHTFALYGQKQREGLGVDIVSAEINGTPRVCLRLTNNNAFSVVGDNSGNIIGVDGLHRSSDQDSPFLVRGDDSSVANVQAITNKGDDNYFGRPGDNMEYMSPSDIAPIGGYIFVQTDLSGAEVPDPENFIKLTAGEDGAGEYNEGKLTNESVSGSAPLVEATAEISDSESPMNGQTVHLLNTENRYLQPGESPGTVANDQMQQITGSFDIRSSDQGGPISYNHSGAITSVENSPRNETTFQGTGDTLPTSLIDFDSSDSPNARTGDHTNVKHLIVTVYQRIK